MLMIYSCHYVGHLLNKMSVKTGEHVDDVFMAIGRTTPLLMSAKTGENVDDIFMSLGWASPQ